MPHLIPKISAEALAELTSLRESFIENRMLFLKGDRIVPLLAALGATQEDFASIQLTSESLEHDPTLPFRRSKNGRFCFDMVERTVERLEFQPFVLSASEDFVRHDSGQVRHFEQVGNDLQMNSVLQALLAFKAFMFAGVQTKRRELLDYDQVHICGLDCEKTKKRDRHICTLFHLRTVTQVGLIGEPALEGVHSDGVDFTMTTFLGSENMSLDLPQPGSAVTFLHSLEEENGVRYHEANPKHVLGSVQHRAFLDTLLIADHEYKHSLSPVWQVDEGKPATRDMLIFFTRRPVIEGHPSSSFDSTGAHKDFCMKMDLWCLPSRENEDD
ncbi:unnamed protein product [Discula destructiva]